MSVFSQQQIENVAKIFEDMVKYRTLSNEQEKEIATLKVDNKKLEEDYLKLQERLEEADKYKDRFLSLNSWLVTEVKLQDILEAQKPRARIVSSGVEWVNLPHLEGVEPGESVPKGILPKIKIPNLAVSTEKLGNALRGVSRDAHNLSIHDDVPTGGLTDKD